MKKTQVSKPTFKFTKCDLKETHTDRGGAVQKQIFEIRGQRVMFDHDLAKLYGASTKRLN